MALNKFFWPAAAWTILITISCLVSMDNFSGMDGIRIPYKDKYVHFCFYFVFTVFWYLFFKSRSNNRKKLGLTVFVLAVSYGALVELFQGVFTTGRSADIIDVLANTGGSAAAILTMWLLNKLRKN